MARHVNKEGIACIKQWEGKRLTAYQDSVGEWTIGYGHTSAAGAPKVAKGLTITDAQAEEILKRDLVQFENLVTNHVKVPLTDRQFTVLVSFAYNVGPGGKTRPGFTTSTLLKKLNKGDYDAVPGELMKWIYAGGRKLKGLVNRRAAEAGIWAKGEFVASAYVDAAPQPVEKASQSAEGRGAIFGGVGVVGTACTDAASQLAPHVEVLPALRWLFIGLTVFGLAFGLYATVNRIRSSNA